jgi:hypothetical protein
MTIKDYYLDALYSEDTALAHYFHYLVAEQKVSLDDDVSILDTIQVDVGQVRELIQKNVLGIHKICIYSLKMDEKNFIFIFATSREEAITFYTKTFHRTPLNCHNYPLDFLMTRGNRCISFRDMRKDFESFPAIAGFFEKGLYM